MVDFREERAHLNLATQNKKSCPMDNPEQLPKTQSSGNLKPPRPPKPPVVGAAWPEDNDEDEQPDKQKEQDPPKPRKETVRISLAPKAKETVRIAIARNPDAG
jgi:hypothetical protein